MKIIVACDRDMVTNHFGHCEGFKVYEIENEKIINIDFVPNPGHKKGFLPMFLNDLAADIVISGGMGSGAVQLFNENGIEVITGAQGKAHDVVNQYLLGNLESSNSVCNEHRYHNDCH